MLCFFRGFFPPPFPAYRAHQLDGLQGSFPHSPLSSENMGGSQSSIQCETRSSAARSQGPGHLLGRGRASDEGLALADSGRFLPAPSFRVLVFYLPVRPGRPLDWVTRGNHAKPRGSWKHCFFLDGSRFPHRCRKGTNSQQKYTPKCGCQPSPAPHQISFGV